MKLLIVTQVIDKDHPILGFFHRWVEEFAEHCEHIQVIALQVGNHKLPSNVSVHSLGKEKGQNRFGYLVNFFKLIWTLRNEYDNVFVHMNQIYVILGAPFWRASGKKVGLWYAHGAVTTSLKLAVSFSDFVFTSTKEGLRIETEKRTVVGQGIDVEKFKPSDRKSISDTLRLVTVGRISQSKNLDTLLRACSNLKQAGVKFEFKIVGTPITTEEAKYEKGMKTLAESLGIIDEVGWIGAISNHELPSTLQASDIFIHDGSTNSLDKTLLEAILCGCIVVSSNPAYKALVNAIIPESVYKKGDDEQLCSIILSSEFGAWNTNDLRLLVKNNFTIANLTQNIIQKYK